MSAAAPANWSSARVPDTVHWWTSLPLGSGDIAADYLDGDPPTSDAFLQARLRIAEGLRDVAPPEVALAVAVGGSATSLRRVDGPGPRSEAFNRSLGLLATERAVDVARRFALDIERVELLPAGLLILQEIAQRFDGAAGDRPRRDPRGRPARSRRLTRPPRRRSYQCTPFIRCASATCSVEARSLGSRSPREAAESGKTL